MSDAQFRAARPASPLRLCLYDELLGRLSDLLERARLDLANAFTGDVEFQCELFQRQWCVGQMACLEDATLTAAQDINRTRERLVPIGHGALDSDDPAPMLQSCNLISGVIDARSWTM